MLTRHPETRLCEKSFCYRWTLWSKSNHSVAHQLVKAGAKSKPCALWGYHSDPSHYWHRNHWHLESLLKRQSPWDGSNNMEAHGGMWPPDTTSEPRGNSEGSALDVELRYVRCKQSHVVELCFDQRPGHVWLWCPLYWLHYFTKFSVIYFCYSADSSIKGAFNPLKSSAHMSSIVCI